MVRLLVHVEGQTEETFVNELLAPYLYSKGFTSVAARLVGDARQRNHRGGIRSWSTVCREIVRHLKQDPSSCSTTMVDYYGLPKTGSGAWPGRKNAELLPYPDNVEKVQRELSDAISKQFAGTLDSGRFTPYVMMHEFEGLLFSDCDAFGRVVGKPSLVDPLGAIRRSFASPEEINDSPQTAPSKRIISLYPEYQKTLHGPIIFAEIGIDKIAAECAVFRNWLLALEALV